MVRHQPLQYYEPQLCLSCLTGIYGCRWKRYQRSHDDTTPWERLWFLLLTFTFGLTLTWLYFWWEVHNDYDEFNWYLYNRMGYWSDWSVPILMTTAAAFTYIAGLQVLALCHIAVGQQMNLHWLHKIGLVAILVAAVVAMSAVAQLWEDEWEVLLISLQGTAPFLHVGALVAVTALSWIVAGQFARAERSSSQIAILGTFFTVVFALYLAPLTISSPCIMEKKDLGPKPALIGHRGAPMLAPEHTLMSFRKALEQKLYGLQADVTISLDGVPFLMHDATLRRTTNVEEEFPELARRPASMLNWTILQKLNAGQWFLKTDPFWTASSLSPSDHREAQNQSICRLVELLELAKGNATLLLNLRDPPREHPYRGSFLNITLEALLHSGFPQHQVLWLPNRQRPFVQKVAPGFQQVSGSKEAAASLRRGHIQRLNLRYTQVSRQELRDYASWNLSVNLYTVNAPWLFSLLWCAGVPSVTSDNSHTLSQVPSPLWIMPPDEYCLMWVTADLISFTLIIGIFVLQKWRLGGIRSYNPEQIMLSAAVRRTSRDVSIMKEKLIFSEISDGMEVSDELSVCSDNSYDTYADSATAPVAPRGSGSRAKTLTDRSGPEPERESRQSGRDIAPRLSGVQAAGQTGVVSAGAAAAECPGEVMARFMDLAEMIVVIGGCDRKGLLKLPFTDAYHPDSRRWTPLPSLPGYARSEFATCTLRNDIYVSGGHINSRDVWMFSSHLHTWIKVASLRRGRWRHKMAVVQGQLFVVGGFDGLRRLRSVERYDPFSNTWASVAPLPEAVSSAAVAPCAGRLYVIGGAGQDGVSTNKVQCFDSKEDRWSLRSPAPFSQRCLDAVSLENTIYVVGGLMSKIFTYDPGTDVWGEAAVLPSPVESCGVTVCDGKVHILGGRDDHGESTDRVFTFDPSSGQVEAQPSLQRCTSSHGCVTIVQSLGR
ncbi:hypothetical protein JEQ12_006377 [Ovis aries]|uniref:GP-PDE domain-containing protein n=1 Tax=Ovis aries TaxID=9940 RepID=A0A836CW90_SHEEP|nr:hypothetical protein JEQ12_006377 [Ovis aries]